MPEPTFDDPLDEGALTSGFEDVSSLEGDGEAASPAEESASVAPETASRNAPARDPARPKKPGFDTYTAMLAFSLIATVAACVFLALELRRYDWNVEIPAPPAVVSETP